MQVQRLIVEIQVWLTTEVQELWPVTMKALLPENSNNGLSILLSSPSPTAHASFKFALECGNPAKVPLTFYSCSLLYEGEIKVG